MLKKQKVGGGGLGQRVVFRVFRRHGGTDNFNTYHVVNEELTELWEKLKPENFKQYCSTLNCHSSLREMYDMDKHYCGVQRRRHMGVKHLNTIGLSISSRMRN
jgi:hypothetical protein